MRQESHQPDLASDGYLTDEIGSWALEKYDLLRHYAGLFSAAMKNKWKHRVYIDLFSGPGRAVVRGDGRLVETSPLIALSLPQPFDHYVFCELSAERLSALRERAAAGFPEADVRFVGGDVNSNVEALLRALPVPGVGSSVLHFCFADPYCFKNLRFTTIEKLSARFVDFLILIPTAMEGQRNLTRYLENESHETPLDSFLGTPDWRAAFDGKRHRKQSTDALLADLFYCRMKHLDYQYGGIHESVLIRNREDKNQPLYRLGFFSRSELGHKFWEQAKKAATQQGKLF